MKGCTHFWERVVKGSQNRWKREDISSDKNKKPNEVLYWAGINWKTLFFNQNETFNIYFDL